MDLSKLTGFIQPALDLINDSEKGAKTISKVLSILPYAIPVARFVAAQTQTTVDDSIVAAMSSIGNHISNIRIGTKEQVGGAKLELTAEMLREQLLKEVSQGNVVKFADRELKTKEDVLLLPRRLLRSAAELAHNINKEQID